ncbi:ABC transporter ATP-binding protein [Limisalsivibrio acetivorans]|uniref:ABC transporter ATP-binding protein n=1 Tax=Limisalsivibrio acetivorans TaxID=1304888 RepID=UPI0003B55389|nr:ABC transporter ATP-binding protein [Limisalsivibrio acetivorans]
MIRVDNICKTFNPGTVNENRAIDGVSLDIKKGDFITVIGGNGSGKSTLLNLIAGYLRPDTGSIFIDDVDVSNVNDYKRATYIGIVFQDPLSGTAKSLSIEENMAIAMKRGQKRWFGMGVKSRDREFYKEHLAMLDLGLEDRLKDKAGLLSGGQRQALTLLMATLVQPKILLLDEHTAALDPKTADKILKLTEKLVREYNLTTLMVTHNMKQALSLGTRTVMMHGGRPVLDIEGEERSGLTIKDLLEMFSRQWGEESIDGRMLI